MWQSCNIVAMSAALQTFGAGCVADFWLLLSRLVVPADVQIRFSGVAGSVQASDIVALL